MVEESFVANELRKKADLFQQRAALYGDNYKHFGKMMLGLFPNGLVLKTADDFNRIGVFVQLASKLTRYSQQFAKGGHDDSLDDAAVYAMMLKELDTIIRPAATVKPDKAERVYSKKKGPFGSPPLA